MKYIILISTELTLNSKDRQQQLGSANKLTSWSLIECLNTNEKTKIRRHGSY